MKRFATSTLSLVLLTTLAIAQDRTQGGGRDHLPAPPADFPLIPVVIGLLVGLVIGYFLGSRSRKA